MQIATRGLPGSGRSGSAIAIAPRAASSDAPSANRARTPSSTVPAARPDPRKPPEPARVARRPPGSRAGGRAVASPCAITGCRLAVDQQVERGDLAAGRPARAGDEHGRARADAERRRQRRVEAHVERHAARERSGRRIACGRWHPATRSGARSAPAIRRLREALFADARVAAAFRGERHEFRSRLDAARAVVRLAWVSDAFLAQAFYRLKARLQARGVPVAASDRAPAGDAVGAGLDRRPGGGRSPASTSSTAKS